MLIETYFEKISYCHYNILNKKYPFIKMSFYLFIEILCAKISSVYRARIIHNLKATIYCRCDLINFFHISCELIAVASKSFINP